MRAGLDCAVGHKAPNAPGVYDLLGNVREWVDDSFRVDYGGFGDPDVAVVDPREAAGASRVYRGGSWNDTAAILRAANRDGHDPATRYDPLGFRPARSNP